MTLSLRPQRQPHGETAETFDGLVQIDYRKNADYYTRMEKMIKRYEILDFNESKRRINDPITKFGGCPNFLYEQQWPTSAGWENRKMMFVGQVVIEKGMLGNEKGIIAYIFVTHPTSYYDDFFDPDVTEWDGGENRVILQSYDDLKCVKTYSPEGPTLFNKNDEMCEYVPVLKEGFDAEYLTNEEFCRLTKVQQKEYFDLNDKNKIGGTPNFFRGDEWPEGEWVLLLQLKCSFLPFVLRLGSMPVLYVFISKDFTRAGLLIQN